MNHHASPIPVTPPPVPAARPARRGGWALAALSLTLACLIAPPAHARTVLLDIEHADRIAAIDADAPRLSWAMARDRHGNPYTTHVSLSEARSLLLRYSLEVIPSGQRIVHAELVVPVRSKGGSEPRFYLWRVLAHWGPGVCHDYRYIDDQEKLEWTRPGAAGIASDRATRPTDIVRVLEDGPAEMVINVTEDVELWYDERAPNHGWLFSVEDVGAVVHLESPLWETPEGWTLRITYEPRDP